MLEDLLHASEVRASLEKETSKKEFSFISRKLKYKV